MSPFDRTHILLLLATVAFFALTMLLANKLPRKGQNIMFILGALFCAGGIFYRYGLNYSFSGTIHWATLGKQMLQVCNFNLILVLLMLVPRFELARQYSVFFSMFAACTTLVSLSSSWANLHWTDPVILNSWMNHTFAIALPLWMVAARRLKPQRRYIPWVSGCVWLYFTAGYGICQWLIAKGLLTAENAYSFLYDPGGVGLLEWLYDMIGMPYFYLYPLAPMMVVFFLAWAWLFKKYRVQPYRLKN